MSKKETKIKKTIYLTPSTLELVEGFSGVSGQEFSIAGEILILRGLDNVLLAEELSKTIRKELKEIRKENRGHTERLAGLIINLARFTGRIYSTNLIGFLRLKAIRQEETQDNNLYEIEKHGIQKSMKDMKFKEDLFKEELDEVE